jgi:hypothetical protein
MSVGLPNQNISDLEDTPTMTVMNTSPFGQWLFRPLPSAPSAYKRHVLLLPDSAVDNDGTATVPYVRFVLTSVNWWSSGSKTQPGGGHGRSETSSDCPAIPPTLPIAGAPLSHDHARHGTIPEHVWTEFWSELEPIADRMQWLEMLLLRLCGPLTSYWVLFAPTIYDAYFERPRLFPNIPLEVIWLRWTMFVVGIQMLLRLWVGIVRTRTWTLLQDVCARHEESNFAALGWTLECEYEWWMETERRRPWVGSIASRGFRLYLIPNHASGSESNDAASFMDNVTTAAASSLPPMYHNGYLRIPLFQPSLCGRWSPSGDQRPEAYQLLPAGFDTLNGGVWLRFWTEWQDVSKDYLRAPRCVLLTAGATMGLEWILFVSLEPSLVVDRTSRILVIWIYVVVMGLSWLVAGCCIGALFHKRRHLARLHLNDFVQQGYYLEHRTMAVPNAGCCGQLGTVHYWNLHRLPVPARVSDPSGLV